MASEELQKFLDWEQNWNGKYYANKNTFDTQDNQRLLSEQAQNLSALDSLKASLANGVVSFNDSIREAGRPSYIPKEEWDTKQSSITKGVNNFAHGVADPINQEAQYLEPYSSGWWKHNIIQGAGQSIPLGVAIGLMARGGNIKNLEELGKNFAYGKNMSPKFSELFGKGATAVATSPILSIPEAGMEANDAYTQAIRDGKSTDEAQSIADTVRHANMGLLTATNSAELLPFLGAGIGKSMLKNMGKSALTNAAIQGPGEEGGQSIITHLAAGKDIDWNDFAQNSALGAIQGGVFGGIGGMAGSMRNSGADLNSNTIVDLLNRQQDIQARNTELERNGNIIQQAYPEHSDFVNKFDQGQTRNIVTNQLYPQLKALVDSGKADKNTIDMVNNLQPMMDSDGKQWAMGGHDLGKQALAMNLDKLGGNINLGDKSVPIPENLQSPIDYGKLEQALQQQSANSQQPPVTGQPQQQVGDLQVGQKVFVNNQPMAITGFDNNGNATLLNTQGKTVTAPLNIVKSESQIVNELFNPEPAVQEAVPQQEATAKPAMTKGSQVSFKGKLYSVAGFKNKNVILSDGKKTITVAQNNITQSNVEQPMVDKNNMIKEPITSAIPMNSVDYNGQTYNVVNSPSHKASMLQDLGKQIGVNVHFFDGSNNRNLRGFYKYNSKNPKNDIYINAKSKTSKFWAIGHEFAHWITQTKPQVLNALASKISNEQVVWYYNKHLANVSAYKDIDINTKAGINSVKKEMISDAFANRWTDAEFWSGVKNTSPTIYNKLVNLFKQFINNLKGKSVFVTENKEFADELDRQFTAVIAKVNTTKSKATINDMFDVPDTATKTNQPEETPTATKTNTQVISGLPLTKIISGGQTGGDRGGLEAGKILGLKTGGTAPKEYRTHTGNDLSLKDFGLEEDSSISYVPRTVKNVKDSDGTVWFGDSWAPDGKLTKKTVNNNKKPWIENPTVESLYTWLKENNIKTLNVAGNGEGINQGIQQKTIDTLTALKKYNAGQESTATKTEKAQNTVPHVQKAAATTPKVENKPVVKEEPLVEHKSNVAIGSIITDGNDLVIGARYVEVYKNGYTSEPITYQGFKDGGYNFQDFGNGVTPYFLPNQIKSVNLRLVSKPEAKVETKQKAANTTTQKKATTEDLMNEIFGSAQYDPTTTKKYIDKCYYKYQSMGNPSKVDFVKAMLQDKVSVDIVGRPFANKWTTTFYDYIKQGRVVPTAKQEVTATKTEPTKVTPTATKTANAQPQKVTLAPKNATTTLTRKSFMDIKHEQHVRETKELLNKKFSEYIDSNPEVQDTKETRTEWYDKEGYRYDRNNYAADLYNQQDKEALNATSTYKDTLRKQREPDSIWSENAKAIKEIKVPNNNKQITTQIQKEVANNKFDNAAEALQPLLYHISKKFAERTDKAELDDFVGLSYESMMEAFHKYKNPENDLIDYVTKYVEGALKKELSKLNGRSKIDQSDIATLQKAFDKLASQGIEAFGMKIDMATVGKLTEVMNEISKDNRYTPKKVREILTQYHSTNNLESSLDTTVSEKEGDTLTLGETIRENLQGMNIVSKKIRQLMYVLTDDERKLLGVTSAVRIIPEEGKKAKYVGFGMERTDKMLSDKELTDIINKRHNKHLTSIAGVRKNVKAQIKEKDITKDFYNNLGLEETATDEEVAKALSKARGETVIAGQVEKILKSKIDDIKNKAWQDFVEKTTGGIYHKSLASYKQAAEILGWSNDKVESVHKSLQAKKDKYLTKPFAKKVKTIAEIENKKVLSVAVDIRVTRIKELLQQMKNDNEGGKRNKSISELNEVLKSLENPADSTETFASMSLPRFNFTQRLVDKMPGKFKGKLGIANKNVTVHSKVEDPTHMGIVQEQLGSPSYIAKAYKQFKPIYTYADSSYRLEDRLKKKYAKHLEYIYNLVSDKEDRELLDDLRIRSDERKKYFSNKELSEMNIPENVAKAYRMLNAQYSRIWSAINSVRKNMGLPPMGKIQGYIPHFFSNFKVTWVDANGIKQAATHDTLSEAIAFANQVDNNGGKEVYVNYVRTQFSEQEGQENPFIEDKLGPIEQDMLNREFRIGSNELEPDIKNLISKIESPSDYHRSFVHAIRRKGAKGWSTDLRKVDSAYFNRAARYMALEPFKTKSINMFERIFAQGEVGAFDKDWSNNDIANYTKQYILHVNGNPTGGERLLTKILSVVPFLNNYLGKVFGERFALQFANNVTGFITIAKLGVFNVSSAILQLNQLINVFASVDVKFANKALKTALQTETLFGKSPVQVTKEQQRILDLVGFGSDMTNTSGFAQGSFSYNQYLKKAGQVSLGAFRYMDNVCRKTAILGSYYEARSKGQTDSQALQYAKDINIKTNFEYSITDAPQLFRSAGPIGQILFQFKKYGIKEMEFMHDLFKNGTLTQNLKFWIPFLGLCGLSGIPGEEFMKGILGFFTGKDIDLEIKKQAAELAQGNPLAGALLKGILYGGLSWAGLDVGKRIGAGDFIPNEWRDLLGPSITTVLDFTKAVNGDIWSTAYPEIFKAVSPAIGNAMQAYSGEAHSITNRGRLTYQYSPEERFVRLLGFSPIKEAEQRDESRIIKYSEDQNKNNKQKAIDKFVNSPSKENYNTAINAGVTDKQIKNEIKKKHMTNTERAESLMSKKRKGENPYGYVKSFYE